ncbi:hypothetical protein HJC23_013901 [Cyclotella cryptica]|uniref:Bis(5'-adenosyl)-triphosphatase n=1 Tax=Cyclotella cryptica TaxID=29204 RepID=A0ABD3QIV8_9STRA|eukprot:CCRYP_005478-RA/>CCRYP_005478-RA protein AED:0.14 eAED:0.15 QI:0/0/0/1/1/1/2/0/230
MLRPKISLLLFLRPSKIIHNNVAAFQPGLGIPKAFICGAFKNHRRQRNDCTFLSLADASEKSMSTDEEEYRLFGRFKISTSQIFYRSTHSFAMVNLRPLVPGHVLVVSNRVVPVLSDLESDEYDDLWRTVRSVQAGLKNQYKCDAFNVAIQDGMGAGQSVPHVHVHILPRYCGDLERNDDIYDKLESWAPRDELSQNKPKMDVPDDSERRDRTLEEMADEALSYRSLFEP